VWRHGLSLAVAVVVGGVACGSDYGAGPSTPSNDDGGTVGPEVADGSTAPDVATTDDAASPPEPPCDLDAPFGAPMLVPGIHSPEDNDFFGRLSNDELTIYFTSDRTRDRDREPVVNDRDIYVASRTKRTDPFGPPVRVDDLATVKADSAPMLTPDGRSLYFESSRGGSLEHAIWVATRTETGRFTDIKRLTSLDSAEEERSPFFSLADDALWFASDRLSPNERMAIYRAKRNGENFDTPELVEELFTPDSYWCPVLSADGLTIYWASNRVDGGAKGASDIWRARRNTTSGRFGPPENVSEINTPFDEIPTWLSPDGCRLYLQRRSGTAPYSIYVAEKPRKK